MVSFSRLISSEVAAQLQPGQRIRFDVRRVVGQLR